jgi:DNA-binding SARP family transcriptional activator
MHLTERARALGEDREGGIEVLRQAVHLYSGPFAPLLDSDWAQSYRLRLEERFTETATRLNRQLLRQADYAAAIEVSERLLESDPYSETAVYQLMHALSALGDRDSAIRTYRRYSDLLELELGIKPGHEIQQLHSEIRSKAKEIPLEPL